MDLTPLDIYNKEFKKKPVALGAYDDMEVDAFLDRVAKAYEELYNEKNRLEEKVESLKEEMEKYKKMEDALQESMVMAQQNAEKIKANAEREAELIRREAKSQAEEIIKEAKERLGEKQRDFNELEKHEELFRIRFKTLLESHLEMLSSEEDMARDLREKVNRVIGITSDLESEISENEVDRSKEKDLSSPDMREENAKKDDGSPQGFEAE